MSQTIREKNKALVLEAFDTLFNRRDYIALARRWTSGGKPTGWWWPGPGRATPLLPS